MHTHTLTGAGNRTDAHLGQRRRSERDRELWVTDLAKVAYGAWPNHARQIQFNNLPVHRERDIERERQRGREGEREEERSLHFY